LVELPDHLRRWPGLYVRDGERIIEASPQDTLVARSYAQYQDKGPVVGGRRITILTASTTRRVGDEVRIIHVVEFTRPGYQAYVMGPKPIFGEYVNDELVTEAVGERDPLVPDDYSGMTLASPAVDYNYDITTYRFNQTGAHTIQWRLGGLHSNILTIEVTP
jgi:hypothetical protein